LRYARDSYQEVLDATKHQDDKIGRFLTAIAFLIAGALVFTRPEVLQARYVVGGAHLRLPALALIIFMVLVVLSVLLYVLAMGAPLTVPSPATRRRQRHRSYLFFLLIADETRESWWRLWNTSDDEIEAELLHEYVNETRNIAQRVDQKYERANEASALFVVALLFFLLGTVLSVDVLQHATVQANGTLVIPTQLDWSAGPRGWVAAILALFPAALVYQRLRAAQARRLDALLRAAHEGRPRAGWGGLHVLLVAYPAFVLFTLLPGAGAGVFDDVSAALAGLAAVAGGLAWLSLILRRQQQDGGEATAVGAARVVSAWLSAVAGVAVSVLAGFAVDRGWPLWQLALALAVALSPLIPNLPESSRRLHERVRWHLPTPPSVVPAARPVQPGGDGGSA
jgi:hypothetical protein